MTTQTDIQGRFNWETPEVTPSYLQGEDAEAVYNTLEEALRQGISYDPETKTIIGSHTFLAARTDTLLRPLGLRVANLSDLIRPEIMKMIEGEHYSDSAALVFRSMEDSYEKNKPLIKRLAKEVEEANGRLELPVLITGFDFTEWPEDKEGYGIDILVRDDFKAIHDKRLDGKYNGSKFIEIDELGLPRFDSNGKHIWFARNQGLSGLCVNRNLDVISSNRSLAGSLSDGRVVVVSAEGANENFQEQFAQKLVRRKERFEVAQREYQAKLQELINQIKGEIGANR